MVRWFHVIEAQPVPAPHGIVFSTSPRVGTTADGKQVFIKGPTPETVFAEAVGFGLADLGGIDVPRWGLAEIPGEGTVFVSVGAQHRSALEILLRSDLGVSRDPVARCIALDIWLANPDRNVLNFVAETAANGLFRLLAIDFEKAMVLRGTDRFTLATRPLDSFLPKEAFRPFCSGLALPAETAARIQGIPEDEIRYLVHEVGHSTSILPEMSDRVVSHLLVRRLGLPAMLREVWPWLT